MNEIIEKLKESKMRPKWHFVIESVLIVALFVLIFLLTLFITTLLLFYLRRFGIFFGLFPLVLFFLAILFVVIAEILVNHYALVYQKPVIYSLIIILASVLALCFLLDMARLHERIEEQNLPMIRHIYRPLPPPDDFPPTNLDFEINCLPMVY
jgi:hypothetical protein